LFLEKIRKEKEESLVKIFQV